jgi:hypothetical protein
MEAQRASIRDLVYWFIGLNSIENVHLENIKSKTKQMEKCRVHCADAYKFVLYLYLVHQTQIEPPLSRNDSEKYHEHLGEAIDEVTHAFNESTFFLFPTTPKTRKALLYLNQNVNHIEKLETCMMRCGSEWVKQELSKTKSETDSRRFNLDQLQARLFAQMLSGVIGMLPRHNNGKTLDIQIGGGILSENVSQLVRDLEEFIRTSARECILLGFFGVTKAGKSTFLNALIGQSILPSDGRWVYISGSSITQPS